MSKLKLVVVLMIVGFLGLQYTFIVQAQEFPKDQMKKDQTNNQSNNQTTMNPTNKFEFQPLPYSYDALEPFIDKLTVEIHYSKHHKAYYDNFMNAIKGTNMGSMDIKDIFRNISKYPMAVRNNRRMGTCLLFEISEQKSRLYRCILERCKLGRSS